MIERTQDEIDDVLDACNEVQATCGSKYPGMTYEDGVSYALKWVTGESDDHPLDD